MKGLKSDLIEHCDTAFLYLLMKQLMQDVLTFWNTPISVSLKPAQDMRVHIYSH